MTSSVAFAAAHETTLPPYVPPCVPGFQAAIRSGRARIPESGGDEGGERPFRERQTLVEVGHRGEGSPDGKSIAFMRWVGPQASVASQVEIFDVATGSLRVAASTKVPTTLDQPHWSPDGRMVDDAAREREIQDVRRTHDR